MTLPKPKSIEIFVENEKLHNLKILHLSDLHINRKSSITQVQELIDICNDLEFDIAIITGDIIDTKVKFIKEHLQVLNRLKQEVYYISGNHDLFYGLEDLKKELTNFIFMDNNCKEFIYKNEIIYLAGLSDRFSKFFKIKREEKNGLKEEVIQVNELLSIKSLKLKYYNNWKALVSTKLLYFQKSIKLQVL